MVRRCKDVWLCERDFLSDNPSKKPKILFGQTSFISAFYLTFHKLNNYQNINQWEKKCQLQSDNYSLHTLWLGLQLMILFPYLFIRRYFTDSRSELILWPVRYHNHSAQGTKCLSMQTVSHLWIFSLASFKTKEGGTCSHLRAGISWFLVFCLELSFSD